MADAQFHKYGTFLSINNDTASCKKYTSGTKLHSYYVRCIIGRVVSVREPTVYKQEQCYGAEGCH
jgi:hypothetical protein